MIFGSHLPIGNKMFNVIKKGITIGEDLKKRIDFICGFCNAEPTFINGVLKIPSIPI